MKIGTKNDLPILREFTNMRVIFESRHILWLEHPKMQ